MDLYWRQVLPWVPASESTTGRLAQATGKDAAVINRVAAAHEQFHGLLPRLRRDKAAWGQLRRDVARTIEIMPLGKLQTVGPKKLHCHDVGQGNRIELHGEVVYCLRLFRELIGDIAETAWVRFVRHLPRNQALLGEADLHEFLFGTDRSALRSVRDLLREVDGSRCFYCADALRGEPVVDHFVPWARYPLDLGHNFVLADARCNGGKLDRLAAFEHLERWCARNARPDWTAALYARTLPHDVRRTKRVASWAYAQAEHGGATVWQRALRPHRPRPSVAQPPPVGRVLAQHRPHQTRARHEGPPSRTRAAPRVTAPLAGASLRCPSAPASSRRAPSPRRAPGSKSR